MESLITVDELAKAIEAGIGVEGEDSKLEYEQAYDLAQHVLNFFGYSNRIIDNVLEPEDRDTFYMLEDADILITDREEITLYDGREWRIHYWLFRHDKIREIINRPPKAPDTTPSESKLYEDLDDSAWRAHDFEAEVE